MEKNVIKFGCNRWDDRGDDDGNRVQIYFDSWAFVCAPRISKRHPVYRYFIDLFVAKPISINFAKQENDFSRLRKHWFNLTAASSHSDCMRTAQRQMELLLIECVICNWTNKCKVRGNCEINYYARVQLYNWISRFRRVTHCIKWSLMNDTYLPTILICGHKSTLYNTNKIDKNFKWRCWNTSSSRQRVAFVRIVHCVSVWQAHKIQINLRGFAHDSWLVHNNRYHWMWSHRIFPT